MTVLCIKDDWRCDQNDQTPMLCPRKNKTYEVIDTKEVDENGVYYLLEEFPSDWWDSKAFVPLVSDEVLEEELASIGEEVFSSVGM